MQPTLTTERLVLRPFTLADGPDVERLAGAREVASTTMNIPHPYPEGGGAEWIGTHAGLFDKGERVVWAITEQSAGLVGAINLNIANHHQRAELGYWVGVPWWKRGYATEASRAALRYGFETLGLHRIHATYLTRNPASGRVMEKLGMTFEGISRGHFVKWGVHEDVGRYGMLNQEFRRET